MKVAINGINHVYTTSRCSTYFISSYLSSKLFPLPRTEQKLPQGHGIQSIVSTKCSLLLSLCQPVSGSPGCGEPRLLLPRCLPISKSEATFFLLFSSVLSRTGVGSLGRAGFLSPEQWGSESMWMVLAPQLPRQFSRRAVTLFTPGRPGASKGIGSSISSQCCFLHKAT